MTIAFFCWFDVADERMFYIVDTDSTLKYVKLRCYQSPVRAGQLIPGRNLFLVLLESTEEYVHLVEKYFKNDILNGSCPRKTGSRN